MSSMITPFSIDKYKRFKKNITNRHTNSFIEKIDRKAEFRFANIFSKPEEKKKIYNFFDIPEKHPYFISQEGSMDKGMVSAWREINEKINKFVVKVVMAHPRNFSTDKELKSIANTKNMTIWLEEKITEGRLDTDYIYLVKNKRGVTKNLLLLEKSIDDSEAGTDFKYQMLFSDESLSKKKFHFEITQYYLKDIHAHIVKKIKEGKEKFQTLTVDDFFYSTTSYKEEKTKEMLLIAKEVMLKKSFLKTTKGIENIKTLSKSTFRRVFIHFIQEVFLPSSFNGYNVANSVQNRCITTFYSFLKRHKIYQKHFDPKTLTMVEEYNLEEEGELFENLLQGYLDYANGKVYYLNNVHLIISAKETLDLYVRHEPNKDYFDYLKRRDIYLSKHIDTEEFKTALEIEALKDPEDRKRNDIEIFIEERRNILRKLNPKRYTFKTKELLKKHYIETRAIDIHILMIGDRRGKRILFPQILLLVDYLKAQEVNEKTIRMFISRFIQFKNFTAEELDYNKEPEIHFSSQRVHSVLDVLLNSVTRMLKTLNSVEVKKPRLLNALVKDMSRYSNSLESEENLKDFIFMFERKALLLKKIEDKPLKLKELEGLLEEMEDTTIEEKYKDALITLNIEEDRFSCHIAKKMGIFQPYVSLLHTTASYQENKKNFLQKPSYKGISLYKEKYSVNVFPHNRTEGMMGANVKGVCISPDGEERQEHITKNFMNLCVMTKDNILLWGLFCSAQTEKGKRYLILNNLQGSINNSSIEPVEVRESIYEAMRLLISENNLQGVLFLDNGFNAIRLTSSKKYTVARREKLTMAEKTRLDFHYDQKTGIVLSESMNLIGDK